MRPSKTLQLAELIGSPLAASRDPGSHEFSEEFYQLAFENRVELLYLERCAGGATLEERLSQLRAREALTRRIAVEASQALSKSAVDHLVFKSIKPYAATPNDTDIVCLGDEDEYIRGCNALLNAGFRQIASAPMQTLLYHPSGQGQVTSKKRGGTFYVDFYRGIAVDYFEYLDRSSLRQYGVRRTIEAGEVRLLAPEPELAIVLFHNVFPEKTFQLEHYYLFAYALANPQFRLAEFVDFVEDHALVAGVVANLAIIGELHRNAFGSDLRVLDELHSRWPHDRCVAASFLRGRCETTFIFSPLTFWRVFALKLQDPFARRALGRQLWHMRRPRFLLSALAAVSRRTFGGRGIYEHK